jgi:hypothetical protein
MEVPGAQLHEGFCASEAAPTSRIGAAIRKEVNRTISEPFSAADPHL